MHLVYLLLIYYFLDFLIHVNSKSSLQIVNLLSPLHPVSTNKELLHIFNDSPFPDVVWLEIFCITFILSDFSFLSYLLQRCPANLREFMIE